MSHTLKPSPDKAIFRISEDFSQLMLLREIMASENEDTAAIDREIANYFARDVTREKIDTVINFLRYAESQQLTAAAEAKRTKALKNRWEAQIEFLKDAAKAVLENSGQKALEGAAAGKLILKKNGSVQPLEITDASLIPDELVRYEGHISGPVWKRIWAARTAWSQPDRTVSLDVELERVPHNERIRAELERDCERCDGNGIVEDVVFNDSLVEEGQFPCRTCDGTGKRHVPGARLLERGSHVEIK